MLTCGRDYPTAANTPTSLDKDLLMRRIEFVSHQKIARQDRGLIAGAWRAGTLLLKCTARINGVRKFRLKPVAVGDSGGASYGEASKPKMQLRPPTLDQCWTGHRDRA
jgi:hypothetical protein